VAGRTALIRASASVLLPPRWSAGPAKSSSAIFLADGAGPEAKSMRALKGIVVTAL